VTFQIIGLGVVAWLLMVAGIAKIAESRGRFAIGWAAAAAAAGASAFLTASQAVVRAIDQDTLGGGSTPLMLVPLPPIALVVSMCAMAGILYTLPIKVSSRRNWPVTRMAKQQETGRLVLGNDAITIEMPSGTTTVPTAQLRSATADGECLRIAWVDGDVILMPRNKPDTPDGHKQQSRSLEHRLRTLAKESQT
jgi:hypothetical protein